MPFRPTYAVQLGGAFLNKVTPNGVGGMASPQFQLSSKDGRRLRGGDRVGGPANDPQHRGQYRTHGRALAATGRKTSVHFSLRGHEWLFLVIAGALIALPHGVHAAGPTPLS